MAELEFRISELPGADPLNGVELVPMVQNGQTVIRSVSDIVYEGGLQDHIDAVDPHPQYTTEQEASDAAPVQSVDSRTGDVDLSDRYEPRRQNNLSATTDPTVNDDSTQGYVPLSRWVNTATAEIWLCVDATAGAANWQTATLTLDELGSAALVDVGTGVSEVPTNGDLGSASLVDVGSAPTEISLNQDFGTAAREDIGTAPTEVPLNQDFGTAAREDMGTGPNEIRTNQENEDLFTDEQETTTIAEDNAIVFAIALG